MLSKALLKLVKSLEMKKFRKEYGLFVAEGGKTVCDLINQNIGCLNHQGRPKYLIVPAKL